MTDRAFTEKLLVSIGLCVVGLAALTSYLQYAAASRGSGNWERLDDPMTWMWTAVAAFFIGFWGFGAFLLSALSPKQLGRVMFTVLAVLYLLFAALVGEDALGNSHAIGMLFDIAIIPVMSAIVMLPLYGLIAFIGRKAG